MLNEMEYFINIERILLTNVAEVYGELKTIDDKTMKGLAYFYGYEVLLHGVQLLQHSKRITLFRTAEMPSRRLYQFDGNKNQVSVYTLSSSNFCTCTFYKEHILNKQDFFACPHNIAAKLNEAMLKSNNEIEIEAFDVSHQFLIGKITKFIEQTSEIE